MSKKVISVFPRGPETKFNCPISTYILWHHNLIYKECPVVASERDMKNHCEKCPLRGAVNIQKLHKTEREKEIKSISQEQVKPRESIPKIGKTYTSK